MNRSVIREQVKSHVKTPTHKAYDCVKYGKQFAVAVVIVVVVADIDCRLPYAEHYKKQMLKLPILESYDSVLILPAR